MCFSALAEIMLCDIFSSRGRQKMAKNEVICVNIIILLILFYGNVFHYYIHDVINYKAKLTLNFPLQTGRHVLTRKT